jgi:hypothetical protein
LNFWQSSNAANTSAAGPPPIIETDFFTLQK